VPFVGLGLSPRSKLNDVTVLTVFSYTAMKDERYLGRFS